MRRAAILSGILLLAAGGCGQESTTPAAMNESIDLAADQVTNGVTIDLLDGGVRTAIVRSDSAYTFGRYSELFGVDATFNTETGAENGTVTSEFGVYDMDTKVFIARGDVVLITQGPEGPRQLETDELHYGIAEDRIWTDQPFTLIEGDRITQGTRFRTDSNFQTWEVSGVQTTGTVRSDTDSRF